MRTVAVTLILVLASLLPSQGGAATADANAPIVGGFDGTNTLSSCELHVY